MQEVLLFNFNYLRPEDPTLEIQEFEFGSD